MADGDNIFNNSGVVIPDSLRQDEPTRTEDVPPVPDAPVVTPDEGQVTPPATIVEPTVPEWQSKFKTPEEMYAELNKVNNSYGNLRTKFTQTTQEFSTLRKAQGGAPTQTTEPQTFTDPSYRPTQEDMIISKVSEIVAPIKEQNDELMMQNTVSKLINDHPDFIELAPNIKDILADDPAMWNLKNPLEAAYKQAKSDKLASEIGKAVADARKDAYADKDIKVMNGDTKTPVSTQTKQKSEEETIRDSILASSSYKRGIF